MFEVEESSIQSDWNFISLGKKCVHIQTVVGATRGRRYESQATRLGSDAERLSRGKDDFVTSLDENAAHSESGVHPASNR